MHCKSLNYIFIRNSEETITSNLNKKVLSLMTNKTLFNSNTSGIIYEGDNLNIKISNNTKRDVEDARLMNLGIVDFGDCEDTLKKNNIIPMKIECTDDCVYKGLDEHGYAMCSCNKLPEQKTKNYLKDGVLKLFNSGNYKIITCFMNIFTADITKVYGFFCFLVLTSIYLIVILIYTVFLETRDLMNNMAKVIISDCSDISFLKSNFYESPKKVGVTEKVNDIIAKRNSELEGNNKNISNIQRN